MYLIAAEAGSYLPAELEKAKGYLLDLKAKRLKPEAMETQRTKVGAMDAEQLRTEIADERARELIGEGHRWMDLRPDDPAGHRQNLQGPDLHAQCE